MFGKIWNGIKKVGDALIMDRIRNASGLNLPGLGMIRQIGWLIPTIIDGGPKYWIAAGLVIGAGLYMGWLVPVILNPATPELISLARSTDLIAYCDGNGICNEESGLELDKHVTASIRRDAADRCNLCDRSLDIRSPIRGRESYRARRCAHGGSL